MQNDCHTPDLLAIERQAIVGLIDSYEAFHRKRFETVLAKSQRYCADRHANVLDVGRSVLTTKLLAYYDNVTTLGFPLNAKSPAGIDNHDGSRKLIRGHLEYDLNTAQTLTPVVSADLFDLIVFAEVIEHLYTAPELVLLVLKRLMKPGAFMIVQTPNAAALHKRLFLLAGYNPYERIRLDRENPGHFREYTKHELFAFAGVAGLEVVAHKYKDYFGTDVKSWLYLYIQKALAVVIPAFARGQTLVLRNPF